jgi:hypothetical protein
MIGEMFCKTTPEQCKSRCRRRIFLRVLMRCPQRSRATARMVWRVFPDPAE